MLILLNIININPKLCFDNNKLFLLLTLFIVHKCSEIHCEFVKIKHKILMTEKTLKLNENSSLTT